MATTEQVQQILKLLESTHPADLFQEMNKTEAGIGAVLRFLYESEGPVTAGNISRFMHVSTARVAVLLKKMEQKGLIARETGDDARTTLITLSLPGRNAEERVRSDIYRQISTVIDRVGIDKMMEFISIARDIHTAIKESSLHLNEFD